MMVKTAFVIIITLLVISSIGGIFFYRQPQPKSLGQITYGWNVWPGELPFLVAYDQGLFKNEGLDIKLVEEDSYGKMVDDFSAGKVDSAAFSLVDAVEKVGKGEKLKVVLAADYSNGADGIVAKKEIKNIVDLKGKKVAVEEGTLGDYLLYDTLKKNNLSFSDIREVNLSAQEAAKAFIDGKVDAAVTYEPDFTNAVEKGNGWRIYTSVDSPGLITDVLIFKTAYVEKNPEKVAALVRGYFKAMYFITVNPDKAYEIGAGYFKITPGEFKKQYAGLKQVGFDDNQRMMPYGSSNSSLHGLIKDAYSFLNEIKKVNNKIDSTEIIDPSFIRGLTQ